MSFHVSLLFLIVSGNRQCNTSWTSGVLWLLCILIISCLSMLGCNVTAVFTSIHCSLSHAVFVLLCPSPCMSMKTGEEGRGVWRSDTEPCMLRWSRIASRQMVCRLITRSTRPIAGDETVLTVSNALPRGPYHPSLLACPSPLFLSSWCYLSGDLCRNVQLFDLPGPPPSFLQGRQPVISWAMQR